MKYLKYILVVISFTVFAQGIRFEFTNHDFGHIDEDKGPVMIEFKFTNVGSTPLQVKEVKASCDCTTPGWTMAQVDPGYNGYIKAKYDPTNRPGAFKKSLSVKYVYQNTELYQVLTITGFVDKGINSKYPSKKGSLRSDAEYFSFYSVTTKAPVSQQIKLYNAGEKAVTIIGFENLPAAYTGSILPGKLQSKDSATFKLTFDPKKRNKIGDLVDTILVKTDDETMPVKSFFVLATVHTYFPPLSREDSLKAPRISIPQSTIDAGSVKQGDTIKVSFDLINTGKHELKILSSSTSCACTISKPEKDVLKSGEQTKINVAFNTAGKSGKNTKQIYLFTNDPYNPEPILKLKSDIQVTAGSPSKNEVKPDSTGTK